jgi:hypothetical protein
MRRGRRRAVPAPSYARQRTREAVSAGGWCPRAPDARCRAPAMSMSSRTGGRPSALIPIRVRCSMSSARRPRQFFHRGKFNSAHGSGGQRSGVRGPHVERARIVWDGVRVRSAIGINTSSKPGSRRRGRLAAGKRCEFGLPTLVNHTQPSNRERGSGSHHHRDAALVGACLMLALVDVSLALAIQEQFGIIQRQP